MLLKPIISVLLPGMVSGLALSRRAVICDVAVTAANGDTCESLAAGWGISVDELARLNPGISCPGLDTTKEYCVMGTVVADPSTTISTQSSTKPPSSTITKTSTSRSTSFSTATKPSSSTSATPSSTPSPIQDGMVGTCNRFHFVEIGQDCSKIAALYSISVPQFIQWNPAAKADCTGLWAETHACVGVIGGNPTPTTTQPGNGVATPTPPHPGMISNCNKFAYVNPGDTCDGIGFWNGVGGQWVKQWNGIEEECRSIQAKTYVCVGVISGNGIPTPTPPHPGMVRDCNKFAYVNPGDTCDGIGFWNGVGGQWVKQWNGIEEECRSIQAYTYVCVGVV